MADLLSFKVCGSADNGRFGEPVLLPDFFFAVVIGEVARRSDGNGVNGRDFLQNEAVFSTHDVNRFAPAGFFHQPPQIGFGIAETEAVRPQIDFPFSGRRMISNFHGLIVAYLWANVNAFGLRLRLGKPSGLVR
jgi:hypothetical protein